MILRYPHRSGILAIIVIAALLVPQTALACIWDDDTLREEMENRRSELEILVGRFDVYPPIYYERRIEIARERIENDPNDLGAYDNAGAASDRLGLHDDAIEWMTRKRDVLGRIGTGHPEYEEHTYRYLANLGTFHAHRWFANGGDREELGDLEHGRDLIAEAIELNPDAHFGREKYQLMVMEWFLNPPDGEEEQDLGPATSALQAALAVRDSQREAILDDAIAGFLGLVHLGAAMESADIYFALAQLYKMRRNSSMALIALNRAADYAPAGTNLPLAPGAFESYATRHRIGSGQTRDWKRDQAKAYHETATAAAREWRTARQAYFIEAIESGRHPDTDPIVREGAPDSPALPSFPSDPLFREVEPYHLLLGVIALLLVIFLTGKAVMHHLQQRAIASCQFIPLSTAARMSSPDKRTR